MRRLIINADDFGLTPGVNRAVLEAHSQGVVTSTTLMAGGSSFADAARMVQAMPRLSIGCHVVLVDGSPVLAAAQVPSLLNSRRKDEARFRDGLRSFVLAAIGGRLAPDQIEAEATAQIRKLQAADIHVSHLDTHKHTHIVPQVLRPLLRAAKACGVRALRNPFGSVGFRQLARHLGLWGRWLKIKSSHSQWGKFHRAVQEAGMVTPDGTFGILATGIVDEQLFCAMMQNLPEGTWEFVCHPGYNDDDLQNVRTRLRESRQQELKILTAPAIRELLRKSGIKLISYQEFVESV